MPAKAMRTNTTLSPYLKKTLMDDIKYNDDELRRIEALHRLNILDTESEDDYNDIVELAAQICNAPISLITFVDKDRQWFKAKHGVDISETPRDISICSQAIKHDILIVHDLKEDDRFVNNPFVTGEPFIRFYAGIPLNIDGNKLGTLCIFDRVPREITEQQLSGLKILSRQVMKLLSLRAEVSSSASKLSAYFNSTSEEILVLDLNKKIIAFNKEAERWTMNNYNISLKPGDDVSIYIEPHMLDKFSYHFNKAVSGDEQRHETFVKYSKLGFSIWWQVSYIPVRDKDGFITNVAFVNKNISAEKKAQKELQKTRDNLRTVFDNTEVGYILINKRLEILSFNQPAFNYLKSRHGTQLMPGKSIYDYFPEDSDIPKHKMEEALTGGHVSAFDYRVKNPQGTDEWYSIKYSPVRNKDKDIEGLVLSFKNITKRKLSEIDLDKSFMLVSQQNKRLLNFSYIVSHNLRSHASNIKSILAYFNDAQSEEEKKELLGYLNTVSDLLDETLLNLNEIVSINNNLNLIFEPLNLCDYTQKTIQLLSTQAHLNNVSIFNNVIPETIVHYNPAFLESILFNFISNAIKYSDAEKLQPYVYIDFYYDNDKPVLQVSDNGLGINMDKYGDKLFTMYKTFHGNNDARGMGLFISKNQVEFMGGHIEVDSKQGIGSIFKIYF